LLRTSFEINLQLWRANIVIGLGLRQLQEALDRKANEIQHEFIDLSDRIEDIGRQLLELRGEEREQLREQQKALRAQQLDLADEINLWRERARAVLQQPGEQSLRSYLKELTELGEESIKPAIEHTLYILDATPEELAALEDVPDPTQQTPVGRLLERARLEYDLRSSDSAVRQREAVAFANRQGMAQDDEALAEIEGAIEDPDPLVRELAVLTTIELHRFRAMRVADLDIAHKSVQYLSRMNHAAVIPILIEILEAPRTGFVAEEGEATEADNNRSRMIALLRLVEWHTSEAQASLRGRRFDRDQHIVKAAERALDLFPGTWSGPLKGTGTLQKQ
jgi:hypothetical protein